MTPVEFLTARLDEQEAGVVVMTCGCVDAQPQRADCPDFVLADIAAKRAILERLGPPHFITGGSSAAFSAVVAFFIQPFADHLDFNPAWLISSS